MIAYEWHNQDSRIKPVNIAATLNCNAGGREGHLVQTYALQGAGSTSQNNNGSGFKEEQSFTLNRTDVHGIAYAFEPGMAKRDGNPNRFVEEVSPTLRANMGDNQVVTAHAFKVRGGCEGGGKGYLGQDEKAFTISTTQDQQIFQQTAVRRLTEVECERLQGFPDNYTNIRENCPSGARYKALGNSMAVPVMRWIGERINKYECGNL
jgi:DNA (cytosine-5)-methyltransferase 1